LPIIDMHTHVFPGRLAAAVPAIAGRAGIAPVCDGTVDGLNDLMRRAGIDRAVVVPVATKPSQVRSINEWLATLDDERIEPFGAIHPYMDDAEAELERLAALGFRGVKLHPEYQIFRPDDERLDPLYAAAARLNLIVYFHAGEDLSVPHVHSTPRAFCRILDAHPTLTVVLAHMGGFRQWHDVVEHLGGRDVYFDTSFTVPFLGKPGFLQLIRELGVGRIIFGSDAPWADPVTELALLRAMELSPDDLAAILWRNAERLLAGAGAVVAAGRS
jgi:predicted TIM-barrel fold metal-dependent hydrolase